MRKFFEHQLDDDVGVEVEVVGVALEGDPRERRGGVEPIAGVELGELGPKHPVLEARQDLVADPFVERHAARERPAC